MTAFYMFRAYFTTFHGEFRGWKIVARLARAPRRTRTTATSTTTRRRARA